VVNFIRYIAYSISAVTIRKVWNWLTEDVDPIPGTKEFNQEYQSVKFKYQRMKKQKEKYETYRKSR
jgi:hypothetical protein